MIDCVLIDGLRWIVIDSVLILIVVCFVCFVMDASDNHNQGQENTTDGVYAYPDLDYSISGSDLMPPE